jgi:formylglycine-generating enzyme required for sulfatase activity
LFRGEWQKGGWASKSEKTPEDSPFGVNGPEKGRLPVFRVTVTEAHCFAEWLGGRLPTRRQWRKAAGRDDDDRQGPFDGDPKNTKDLAVNLSEGPWPVDKGQRDVSLYGCRQMASNGFEWTRDLDDNEEIPLEQMLSIRRVYTLGQTYLASEPLTFQAMAEPRVQPCTDAVYDISFRVVLEP